MELQLVDSPDLSECARKHKRSTICDQKQFQLSFDKSAKNMNYTSLDGAKWQIQKLIDKAPTT